MILSPGLKIEKVYVGYWFWGRPTVHQLWADLQRDPQRIKADYDPTTPEARAAWEATAWRPPESLTGRPTLWVVAVAAPLVATALARQARAVAGLLLTASAPSRSVRRPSA